MSSSLSFLVLTMIGLPELVNLKEVDPRVELDIRYATKDNFTHQQLYEVAKCYLRPVVAKMVRKSQDYLERTAPGKRLLVKDCYRPVSVQKRMWKVVRGTPMARYVANPNRGGGSVHSFGAAVDVSLIDGNGQELDFGTPYDHLDKLSQPRFEVDFLKKGKLKQSQLDNRRLLRAAMCEGGGFRMISNEWWHFDAFRGRALRKKYMPLDISFSVLGRRK